MGDIALAPPTSVAATNETEPEVVAAISSADAAPLLARYLHGEAGGHSTRGQIARLGQGVAAGGHAAGSGRGESAPPRRIPRSRGGGRGGGRFAGGPPGPHPRAQAAPGGRGGRA